MAGQTPHARDHDECRFAAGYPRLGRVGTRIGVRALLIHAESPEAARFYQHYDPSFELTPGDPLHLVLLMKNIRAALGRVGD